MKKQNLKSAILFAVALLLIIGSIVPMMTERAMAGSLVSITFDANASDGHVTSATGPKVRTISTYDRQYQYSWSFPNAYRTGYTFGGWYDNASCTGTRVLPTNWKTSQTKLYAKWTPVTYTITFKPNGGTGGPTSQVKTHGKTLTITSSKPTKTGYDFVGWATSAGGSAQYYANGSYTKNEGATLYAVWKKKKFTITIYTSTGGPNGSAYTYTKEYGASFTIPSTSAPTGYYLAGYGIPTATTDVKYHVGDVYKEDKHLTLYPIFYKKTYPVTYYANGGSNPPAIQIKTHGENLTLASGSPTRTGYTFQGWGTSANATTVAYSPKAVYTGNEGLQLYAIWKINTYSVTYYANGGTGAPAGQIKTYNSNLSLSTTKPTRTGYTFQGWGTSAGATTVAYKPGATYTGNAVLNLYAIWKIDQYDVVYNANGGTGAPAAVKKSYGQDLTLSGTIPTRDGYDFKGWATSATGAVAYAAGGTYKNNSAVTLYAVWSIKTYKITIYTNPGGQNGSVCTLTKEHGKKVTLPSIAAPVGYVLKGFDEDSTKTTPNYACDKPEGLVYSDDKSVTLYPIFQLMECSVSFDANGGINPPHFIATTYGQEIVLPNVNAQREGYDFIGWSETKGGTVIGKAGAKYKVTKEQTLLYALWVEKTYTVTLCNGSGEGMNPGSVYTLTKYYFSELELPPCSSVEGFTFRGYKTKDKKTGETITYSVGEKYTTNDNATMFAIWEVDIYQIRLHYYNGSEEVVEVVEKTAGEPIVLPSPERTNYIFRGWGDNESAVIKYVPGAQYVANASADLYAKWEKLAIVASREVVSLGINGCSAENPERVFLNAEFNGKLYFTVRSQFGATDWLHVELENKEVRISADPNNQGDTLRGATIVVSNGYGVECCIGVIQEGNFIRLVGDDGVIESAGNHVDICYDENGKYKGENPSFFRVNTGINSFSVEIEYEEGAEAFVQVNNIVEGNGFFLECAHNQGVARKATIVIKSGKVVQRYSVEQEPRTISVTYRFLDPRNDETVELYVHKQDCGTGFIDSFSEWSVEPSVRVKDKELAFSGWRSTQGFRVLKQGEALYEDTVCDAYYTKYETGVDFHTNYSPYQEYLEKKLGAQFLDDVVRFSNKNITSFAYDYRGVPDYQNFFPASEKKYVEDLLLHSSNLWVKFYEYPVQGLTLGSESVLNNNSSLLSMKLKDLFYLKDNAKCWWYTISSGKRGAETVEDQNGNEVLCPCKDSFREDVLLWSYSGIECYLGVLHTRPSVEYQGWDERLASYYGISEEQYNDVRFTGKELNGTSCKLEVKHEISENTHEGGYLVNTSYRVVYYGNSSFSAVSHDKGVESQTIYVRKDKVFEAMTWLAMYKGALERVDENGRPSLSGTIQTFTEFFGNKADAVEKAIDVGQDIHEVVDIKDGLIEDLSEDACGKVLLYTDTAKGVRYLIVRGDSYKDIETLKKQIELADQSTTGKLKNSVGKTIGGAFKFFGYVDIIFKYSDKAIRWELKADTDYVKNVHNAVYDIYGCEVPEVFRGVSNGFYVMARSGRSGNYSIEGKGQINVSPNNPFKLEWNKLYTVTEIDDFWQTSLLSMYWKS